MKALFANAADRVLRRLGVPQSSAGACIAPDWQCTGAGCGYCGYDCWGRVVCTTAIHCC